MRPSEPAAPPPGARSQWETLKDLLPQLWPADRPDLKLRVVLAVLCLVAAKGAIVVVPLLYKEAVDALSIPKGADSLPPEVGVPVFIILAYGAARVFSLSFQELRDFFFAKVGQRAIRQVALQTFRHLHGLSLQFHLDRQTGGLSRVIERGTKAIDTLLSFALFSIIPTFVELGLSVGILWALYGLEVAAITLVTVGGYIAYTYRITEWRLALRRQMNESDQQANTRAIDSLINYETVKYFTNEAHEAARYDIGLRAYEKAATDSKTSLSILNIGQAAIIAVGVTALMLLSAKRVVEGSMTPGDFVAVNAYMMQLAQPLNLFGFVYREVKQALVDMETMFQLLKVEAGVSDRPGAPDLRLSGGRIDFTDVRFGYDAEREILHGIDFSVPPGHTVAVVGPSGAGKSTLARLLFRFYDVTGGRIEIDGQDIRAVTQDSLRRAIGIVPQDTVLFNDTLGYNIAYGAPGAERAAVERAADLAHIGDFVRALPQGFDTLVGERGLKLSGGEKQRVAIARTILKNPAILLFDEATSALDTQTEREIQTNLREVSRGRTTLVIAHRLSTVVEADEILVLEAGRVVERGRHAALLARGGVYAAMWQRQQEARAAAQAPLDGEH